MRRTSWHNRVRLVVGRTTTLRKSLLLVSLFGAMALFAGAAFAGQPVTQTLNPEPAPFLICKAVGGGTICQGERTEVRAPSDTEIVCESDSGSFSIFDQGIVDQAVIRYYDGDGNLTRRVIHETWTSAQFSNPDTGATVPYVQHGTFTDILSTPGDFATSTQTTTGNNVFTVPHMGAVFLNAGKTVYGPDGDLEFRAGPQNFLDLDSDPSVIDELCAALGAT